MTTETALTSPAPLEVREARVHFEGVKAVDGVDLHMNRGEILGLIGPNGAGKTTLVNVLSGFQRPDSGSVHLEGSDVTGWSPSRLARHGLVRTFQGVRLFSALTAYENVEVGALGAGLKRRRARETAVELLERMHLAHRADVAASSLPYGEERRLGIARALATRPNFLLLDEPAAGLNEAETDELLTTLTDIVRDFGAALLVIEHDMRLIMRLCDRIQVLDQGETISEGAPDEVRRDPRVLSAYLGTAGEEQNFTGGNGDA
jgi:branched-chain amino acid transport system ATP-binding protein